MFLVQLNTVLGARANVQNEMVFRVPVSVTAL